MIARCECGALKTIHPYMNAHQVKWLCERCYREQERKRDEEEARGKRKK